MQNKQNIIVGLFVVIVVSIGVIYFKTSKPNVEKQPTPTPTTLKIDKSLTTSYKGTLPCADCSGLETELALSKQNPDATKGTYALSQTYTGKNDKPFVTVGNWITVKGNTKDPNAVIYMLNPDKPQEISYYLKINDKELRVLDNQKNEIDSPFNMNLTSK